MCSSESSILQIAAHRRSLGASTRVGSEHGSFRYSKSREDVYLRLRGLARSQLQCSHLRELD